MRARDKAIAPERLTSITTSQHELIKQLGAERALGWSAEEGDHAVVISKFRQEMKEHYFVTQRRRCCYCSIELHDHKASYDAEHILDKDHYRQYMFEPENLAAACKLCNGSKSNKPVSSSGAMFTCLSRISTDYSIVHPHLDDWSDHLVFDAIQRICARDGSSKGIETIGICGIHALNAARLADEFSHADYRNAESALRRFHESSDLDKKRELIDLLQEMAERLDHAGSKAVMAALRQDVEILEHGSP